MSCVSDHVTDTGVVEATAALDGVARRRGQVTVISHIQATRFSRGLTWCTPSTPSGHPLKVPKSEDHERQPAVVESISLRLNPRPARGLSGGPADRTITATPPYRANPYRLAEPSDRRARGPTEPMPAAPILDRIPGQNPAAETENPSDNGRRPRKRTTLSRYTTNIYNDFGLYWTHIGL